MFRFNGRKSRRRQRAAEERRLIASLPWWSEIFADREDPARRAGRRPCHRTGQEALKALRRVLSRSAACLSICEAMSTANAV